MIDTPPGMADSGYRVSDPQTLELTEQGVWRETALVFSCSHTCVAMTTGKLVIRGSAGDVPVRKDVPIRLGRGALAFLERRSVPYPDGVRALDVTCLENPFLRAEVIGPSGCVASLFSHAVGPDALVPGDHPFGLVWAGFDEWHHSTMPRPGEEVAAVYSGRALGGVANMTVRLAGDSDCLEVTWDARALPASPGPIYLATSVVKGSSLTVPGAGDATAGEILPVPAQGTGQMRVAPAGEGQALVVEYAASTLVSVTAGSRRPWYDYLAFNLGEGSPGIVTFRLRIAPL
ncbi:MAG: hypothetical protein HPY44_07410 [Armatimonadetes bacterium]|nr:hypothetical protein [Armatimonadota bacterium]